MSSKIALATTSLSILLTAACGSVVDEPVGTEPVTAPGVHAPGTPPLTDHPDGEPTTTPSPIVAEAPRGATTAGSLFSMSFAANSPIERVVGDSETAMSDIVEQRLVTATAEPVNLTIELTPPTGRFDRTIVSDVSIGQVQADHVLCESYGNATFDPKCSTVTPVTALRPREGEITEATWRIALVHDLTGIAVPCTAVNPSKVACTLAAGAATSYRVVVAANGFADLWEGPQTVGPQSFAAIPFIGAFAPTEWLCVDWRYTTNASYCAVRYPYTRFNAIDRARLEFDPIQITLTANGVATTQASPALSWDAGDDDLPGTY